MENQHRNFVDDRNNDNLTKALLEQQLLKSLRGGKKPWQDDDRRRGGGGDSEAAGRLRDEAYASAPASAGLADGQRFEWIADADMRLGPVLEAVVNGRYYWIPFSRLARVRFEPPADLRDAVWLPATLAFVNGGETVALVPTRYPGSESAADGLVALARRTLWEEHAPGVHFGLGQRVFATDAGDFALLDLRSLEFDPSPALYG